MSQTHEISEPAPPLHSILRDLDQRWEIDHQVVVSVGGREFVVRDQKTYNQLCSRVEVLETLDALQRSFEDMKDGRVRSLEVFDATMRQKYGISD